MWAIEKLKLLRNSNYAAEILLLVVSLLFTELLNFRFKRLHILIILQLKYVNLTIWLWWRLCSPSTRTTTPTLRVFAANLYVIRSVFKTTSTNCWNPTW